MNVNFAGCCAKERLIFGLNQQPWLLSTLAAA
jgi:hypothetical protein